MKKLFLALVAVLVTAFSANAQVKIESPHPDLDIKVARCSFASGTVVIDLVITNFGLKEDLFFDNFEYPTHLITMYDDEGNSYNSDNSNIMMGFPNKKLDHAISGTFPQDIPLKFRFQFSEISANASKFSLVEIAVKSNGAMAIRADKPLIIRNIEWVK